VLQNFEADLKAANLKREDKIYVHCQGGYRSMIAASLLKRKGYDQLKNILGGWNEIKKTNIKQVVNQTAA
jgi:rhodanese-related sulfurtransferase